MARVEPQTNFEAHSPAPSTVRNLFVHEGDKVPAGKLLLELNDADSPASLAAASTAVKGARATYEAMAGRHTGRTPLFRRRPQQSQN